MDPDSGDYLKASNITKITLLTFVFTACYFYRTRQEEPLLRFAISKKDTAQTLLAKQKPLVKKKKKTIYLSFDDGPNKGTQNVLNIINQEEVDATFFIVGEHVYGSRQQRAVYNSILSSRFVEIANHSYTHAFHNRFTKYYSMPDSVVKDFTRCADSLHLSSGITRTPGRNIWRLKNIRQTDIAGSGAAADSLQNKNYTIMGWDIEWHYNDKLEAIETSEDVAGYIDSMFIHNRTKTNDHLVLLAHDQVYADPKDSGSLHRFIKTLKEKGEYDFSTVKNYPGIIEPPATDSVFNNK